MKTTLIFMLNRNNFKPKLKWNTQQDRNWPSLPCLKRKILSCTNTFQTMKRQFKLIIWQVNSEPSAWRSKVAANLAQFRIANFRNRALHQSWAPTETVSLRKRKVTTQRPCHRSHWSQELPICFNQQINNARVSKIWPQSSSGSQRKTGLFLWSLRSRRPWLSMPPRSHPRRRWTWSPTRLYKPCPELKSKQSTIKSSQTNKKPE